MKSAKRRETRRKWRLRLRVAKQMLKKQCGSHVLSTDSNSVCCQQDRFTVLQENDLDVSSPVELHHNQTPEPIEDLSVEGCSDGSSADKGLEDASVDSVNQSEKSTNDNDLTQSALAQTDTCTDDGSESDCSLNYLSSEISTDESSEDEVVQDEVVQALPLFPGSQITNREWAVAVLSMSLKHSLTNACVTGIINLFMQTLPLQNNLPNSRHMLLKDYLNYEGQTTVHRCCGFCTRLLPSDSKCTITECQLENVSDSVFIEVDLEKQLRTLFSDVKFVDLLKYRFTRCTTDSICDMYDGRIYQENSDFFACPYNVSFTLNYDGAPKFKSTNMQIWPIQFSINELPPLSRRSKSYMVLGGLWCSTEKPPSFTFLEPIFACLKELEENGTEVLIPGKGKRSVKARLLCAVLDLPAKALLLNCNQYNGAFGCSVCKSPGEMVSVGRGRARAYPYQDTFRLREHNDHIKDANDALSSMKVVNGVKGFSALHMLPNVDVIRCTPVDYMHCVLLGVVKKLTTLWFESSNHRNEWYIGRRLKEVDKRLLAIRLPDNITRTPRSIAQRKFWKASEWKSFLLYYIPATLYGILPDKYYIHVFLLIKSIRILLSCSISEDEIQSAEKMLKKFCKLMQDLYGISNCGINFHLLLHLTFFVRSLGPLWTHSAFSFENQIHNLLQYSHATHGIGKQIAESYLLNQRLQVERRKLLDSPSCSVGIKSFLRDFQTSMLTSTSVSMIGSGISYSLEDEQVIKINTILSAHDLPSLQSPCVRTFYKVSVNGITIFTQNYKRVTKRNSYTVSYSMLHSTCILYGLVEKLISVNGQHLAIVKNLIETSNTRPFRFSESIITSRSKRVLCSDYITYELGDYHYIFVHQILQKCCNLSNNSWNILTLPVNNVELE